MFCAFGVCLVLLEHRDADSVAHRSTSLMCHQIYTHLTFTVSLKSLYGSNRILSTAQCHGNCRNNSQLVHSWFIITTRSLTWWLMGNNRNIYCRYFCVTGCGIKQNWWLVFSHWSNIHLRFSFQTHNQNPILNLYLYWCTTKLCTSISQNLQRNVGKDGYQWKFKALQGLCTNTCTLVGVMTISAGNPGR